MATRATIDTILSEFRNARGLVIDLRKNYGGDDRSANEVSNRFATSRHRIFFRAPGGGDRHDEFLDATGMVFRARGGGSSPGELS